LCINDPSNPLNNCEASSLIVTDVAVAPQDATYDSRDAGTTLQVVDAGIAGTPQTIETGPFGDLTGNATGPTDDRDIDDTTTFWGGVVSTDNL